MNKKTQMWIGVVAVAGIALFIYNKNKKPSSDGFANFAQGTGRAAPGCVIYQGSCNASVGTIITSWVQGGQGIIVANNNTRCIVCPRSPQTDTGMPIGTN